MNKKLIDRARKAHTSLGESLHFGLCAELADRIEELEKQLAAARQQVKLLRDAIEAIWTNPNWKPDTMPRVLIDQLQTAYKGAMK